MAESPRIEELKRRVQLDPASIAFAALAEEYRRAGRFEEAIATCEAGLQRHPAYLSAHVTLGRALIETGRFDEARQELEHVLRAAPENLAAIRGLADIHHRRGELPEALEQYRSALSVAKHDTELEQTVAAIAQQVEPEAPAAAQGAPEPEPPPVPAPEVETPRPPAAPRLELVARPPMRDVPEPEPEPEAEPEPESEPVAWDPEPIEAEPEPVAWEPEPAYEASAHAPAYRQPEPEPDPALPGLESFLAAILREKDRLAAGPDVR